MEEQKIKSINIAIKNILDAFGNINAPLSVSNVQCSNAILTNLQTISKLINEETKKSDTKPDDKTIK